VKDLVKHYETGTERVTALNGITLDVQPGRPVGLVGVSGCGKSTLLNLVGGVDRPDSGSIVADGVNVVGLGEREVEEYRLSKVGFVFQSYNLVPSLTAAENLQLPMVMLGRLPRPERQQRARDLLALVGLSHKAGKRPDELSGGEQQRVAIGVALSNDPTILLADEPTANLDHRNLEIVFELLTGLARQYSKTVIVATHDPRIWSRLDLVVRMEEGLVV
jgi:putative ABC transport system ATP-binding protein